MLVCAALPGRGLHARHLSHTPQQCCWGIRKKNEDLGGPWEQESCRESLRRRSLQGGYFKASELQVIPPQSDKASYSIGAETKDVFILVLARRPPDEWPHRDGEL